ncbi:hypothetical protein JXL19_01990 [bacterium]|nr:hypothetical protein [bacterium]
MWSDAVFRKNPMRIFEKCIHGGLGKGNIGVFMSRAGVGKTACLVQISIDNMIRGQNVLHFSVGQKVDDVRDWYDEMLDNLIRSHNLAQPDRIREEIESKRMILSYTDKIFNVNRMEAGLNRLSQQGGFAPDVALIDGYPFESISRMDLDRIKRIAAENKLEIWFAVQTHRESPVINERGIPAPCHIMDDILSVIVFLEPLEDSVRLRLLKDHDNPDLLDLHLLLDINTLLIKDDLVENIKK